MPFDIRAALANLRGRGPLLILPHDNPDPDALACALGLQRIAAHAGVTSKIALGGIIGRAENRAMVRELNIELVPVERVDPSSFPLLALVDTQPRTGNNSLFDGRQCDIVIDHHPPRPTSDGVPWRDIREDVAASTMIVWHYLNDLALPIDARLATAFLYALKSETRDLGRESGEAERAAYLELFSVADHDKLHAIANPRLGAKHFVAVDRALRSAELRGDVLTASLGALEYPDLVAEVADLLLPFESARWVLCAGSYQGTVYLSVRTDIQTARAGELIRRIIGPNGAGGGHGMIAGGRLHARIADDAELDRIYAALVEKLAAELKVTAPPLPLLSL